MRLSELATPFVVCVVYDDEVSAAIRTVQAGERAGADAFELNLPRLGYPAPHRLAPVFEATARPVFTSCRRAPFTDVYGPGAHPARAIPDDERMARQLDALRWGSAGVDMELDTFDPDPAPAPDSPEIMDRAMAPGDPAEVTEHPQAVLRQRELIDRVHALGREVVVSCHAARVLSAADAVRIASLAAARGADLVKIVGVTSTMGDVVELLRATLAVRSAVSVPCNLMSVGVGARLTRFVGPLLGSAWAYGQTECPPGGFAPMPLVRELRTVFDTVRAQTATEAAAP